MSSGVGGSRVSIPNNVRKTIHDIREITGKQHSDDEIYAVLKECSMDPNETAQKLLYLDTFHEVKRRRDRRKENLNSKASEERPAGTQRRGARGGGQGNYGSNFSSEAGGGKNAARRENGASHPADRGSMSSSFPFSQRTKHNAASRVAKATALPNGTANLPNGTSTHGTPKSSVESEGHSPKEINKLGPTSTQPAALGVTSSPTFGSMDSEQPKSDENLLNPISGVHSSDSLSTPSGSAIMVENEAGAQQLAAEPDHVHEDKTVYNDDVSLGQSESDQAPNVAGNKKNSSQPMASEASQTPPLSTCEVVTSEAGAIAAEVCCQSTSELHVSDGQHVTFPNHFQVPEALKSGLTFGSFDVTFGSKVESGSFGADDNVGAVESPVDSDEAAKEPSSDQNVSSIVQGDYLDDSSQSLPHVLEKLQPSEGSTDSKVEQPKQETQYPEGPQNPSVINGTSYSLGLGIMPPMVGSQLVQMEGHEAQAHETRIPNIANGNSPNPPSTNPSPPLPSSIAVSPQSVPVFRQTYPPNFFPYGQYLSPFYMPPMHQFLGHNGFPTQPSTGNVYLPPAPAGVKFSLPQFKPGNNAGNATHIGIQPAGSFITAPVGYAQPVTSGSSMGNEDLVASHLKENQIYTTGQLTEGSAVWIQAAGQDAPSLQVNSLYNLPPQGHIAFSPQQSGHGAFAGIFPPGHAMTAPSTLLQQSQAAAGAIETIGPPSGAYQQSQHAQINWNTAF